MRAQSVSATDCCLCRLSERFFMEWVGEISVDRFCLTCLLESQRSFIDGDLGSSACRLA